MLMTDSTVKANCLLAEALVALSSLSPERKRNYVVTEAAIKLQLLEATRGETVAQQVFRQAANRATEMGAEGTDNGDPGRSAVTLGSQIWPAFGEQDCGFYIMMRGRMYFY
jgi:hypothetical protein